MDWITTNSATTSSVTLGDLKRTLKQAEHIKLRLEASRQDMHRAARQLVCPTCGLRAWITFGGCGDTLFVCGHLAAEFRRSVPASEKVNWPPWPLGCLQVCQIERHLLSVGTDYGPFIG